MIKKHVKWTDHAGQPQEEDWYFHLSRAELTEKAILLMADESIEDIPKKIQTIIDSKDNKLILKTFKEILVEAVGLKNAKGDQFIKSDDNKARFQWSGAMDEVLLWLWTNPFEAGKFIQGMVPPDVIADAEKQGVIKDGKVTDVNLVKNPLPGQEIVSVTPKAGIDGVDDLKPEPQEPQPKWEPTGIRNEPTTPKILTAADMDAMSDEELRALVAGEPIPPRDTRPLWLQQNRRPTAAELRKMPRSELNLAYLHKLGPMSPDKK